MHRSKEKDLTLRVEDCLHLRICLYSAKMCFFIYKKGLLLSPPLQPSAAKTRSMQRKWIQLLRAEDRYML